MEIEVREYKRRRTRNDNEATITVAAHVKKGGKATKTLFVMFNPDTKQISVLPYRLFEATKKELGIKSNGQAVGVGNTTLDKPGKYGVPWVDVYCNWNDNRELYGKTFDRSANPNWNGGCFYMGFNENEALQIVNFLKEEILKEEKLTAK